MKLWQFQWSDARRGSRTIARSRALRWLGGKGHATIRVIVASGVAMVMFGGLQAAPMAGPVAELVTGPEAGPEAGIECDVTARSSDGWTKFSGVVRTPRLIEGEYSLVVVSTATGGTSHVSQRGAFLAKADIPLILGAVVVKAGGNRTNVVRLRLRTSDGQTCEEIR